MSKKLLPELMAAQAHRDYKRLVRLGHWRQSHSLLDHFLYLVVRSRGFVLRNFSRIFREIVELYSLALISSYSNSVFSLSLWATYLVWGGLIEGLNQVLRGSLLEYRRLSTAVVASLSLSLAIGLSGAVLAFNWSQVQQNPVLMLILISKTVAFLLETLMSAVTFKIVNVRRVYISPMWTAFVSAVCLVSVPIANAYTGIYVVATIVGIHFGLKIADEAYAMIRALRTHSNDQRKPREGVFELPLERSEDHSDGFEMSDLYRGAQFILVQSLPLALTVFALLSQNQTWGQMLAFWALSATLQKVIERPFRSYAIDFARQILAHQWTELSRSIYAASRLSAVLGLLALPLVIVLAKGQIVSLPASWFVLALLFTITKIVVLAISLTGVDVLVRKRLIRFRLVGLVAVSLSLAMLSDFATSVWLACCFEALTAAMVWGRVSKVQLGRWLSYSYAQMATQAAPEPKYYPYHFLQAWKVISQRVRQAGVVSEFAVLRLAQVTPEARNVSHFAECIKNSMRRGDLMVMLDPITVGLWLPGTPENQIQAVAHRLMKTYPLDVLGIERLSEEQFLNKLFLIQNKNRQDPASVDLSTDCLDRWGLKDMAARIWRHTPNKGWTNLLGQSPSVSRESLLEKLQTKARASLLVTRHVTLEDRFENLKLTAFRPTGALDFAYESLSKPELQLNWDQFLNAMRQASLETFRCQAPLRSIDPIPFFIVKSLLLALSRQHELSCHELTLSRDEVVLNQRRSLSLITSTEDGDRRGLAVATKEAA
jgi:hypothetical protein